MKWSKSLLFFFKIIGSLLILGLLITLIKNNPLSITEYTIVLTESGFVPETLSLEAGDRVKFLTDRGKPYWPASNEHPIHTVYAEFDPKRPIMPNETWSFTFKKVGQWDFHDHLNPTYLGSIVVH